MVAIETWFKLPLFEVQLCACRAAEAVTSAVSSGVGEGVGVESCLGILWCPPRLPPWISYPSDSWDTSLAPENIHTCSSALGPFGTTDMNFPPLSHAAFTTLLRGGVVAAPLVLALPVLAQGPFEEGGLLATELAAPNSQAFLDYDHDGDLDWLVADRELFVLENLGNLGFGIARPLSLGIEDPRWISAGDEDGDGDADLIVASRLAPQGTLSFFRNDGPSTLVPAGAVDFPGSTDPRFTYEYRDVNADGRADLIETTVSGSDYEPWPIRVAFSRGPFQFDFNAPGAVGLSHDYCQFVDIDGDGLQDVITQNDTQGLVYRRQLQPEVFGPDILIEADLGWPARWMKGEDFDLDGDMDLVVHLHANFGLLVFQNLGSGGFAASTLLLDSTVVTSPRAMDVDGDGDSDLVFDLTGADGSFKWVENLGGFSFSGIQSIAGGLDYFLEDFDPVDVNGDGIDDVAGYSRAYSGDGARRMTHLPGRLTGPGVPRWGHETQISGTFQVSDPVSIDWDADGDLDLIWKGIEGLHWSANRGPGRFDKPALIPGTEGSWGAMYPSDLASDGGPGLLVWRPMFEQPELLWFQREPDGTATSTVIDGSAFDRFFSELRTVDIDSDGDLDIVGVAPTRRTIAYLEQVSPGTFLPVSDLIPSGNTFEQWDLADIDSDGDLDILVSRYVAPTYHRIDSFRGQGDGTFCCPMGIRNLGRRSDHFFARDLDGSGTADLVWVLDDENDVQIASGIGDGTFGPTLTIADFYGEIESVDFLERRDGAGYDIVASEDESANLGHALWFVRRIAGLQFAAPDYVSQDGVDWVATLVAGDFDGDGDADVVADPLAYERAPRWYSSRSRPELGESYCDGGQASSTGRRGRLRAVGERSLLLNDIQLVAADLPAGALTLFLTSLTQATTPMPGGSRGTLCLGGSVGRFLRPGEAGPASAEGSRNLLVDRFTIPQSNGFVPIVSGQTWSFQAWHRDAGAGFATSNFTAAVAVNFY